MLFIATPCTEMIHLPYHLSMIKLATHLEKNKIPFQYATLTDCNSQRSRAELTTVFLKSNCEKMLFIDSDMEFAPEDVTKLYAHDYPIIGGTYTKRSMDWNKVSTAIKNEDPKFKCHGQYTFQAKQNFAIQGDIIEVQYAATGFLMMKKSLIQKVIEANPETVFNSEKVGTCHAIYDNIIKNGQYLSGDFSFCERIQRLNVPIHIDFSLKLNHVGFHTFPGDPTVCIRRT